MKQIFQNYKNIENKNMLILFIILPITLIIGSAASNANILLINILFIIKILKRKELQFLINRWFYILLFLWFCLLENSYLIAGNNDSLIRSIGFFRFVLLKFFTVKFL